MEGNRPVRLYPLVAETTAAGGEFRTYPESASFIVWATRRDRPGRIDADATEQRAAEWYTEFTIRRPLGANVPTPDWRVTDQYGTQYLIDAVTEVQGSRGAKLQLLCVRGTDLEEIGT